MYAMKEIPWKRNMERMMTNDELLVDLTPRRILGNHNHDGLLNGCRLLHSNTHEVILTEMIF